MSLPYMPELEIPDVYPLDGPDKLEIVIGVHMTECTDGLINGRYFTIRGYHSNVLSFPLLQKDIAQYQDRNVALRGAVQYVLDLDFPNMETGPEGQH